MNAAQVHFWKTQMNQDAVLESVFSSQILHYVVTTIQTSEQTKLLCVANMNLLPRKKIFPSEQEFLSETHEHNLQFCNFILIIWYYTNSDIWIVHAKHIIYWMKLHLDSRWTLRSYSGTSCALYWNSLPLVEGYLSLCGYIILRSHRLVSIVFCTAYHVRHFVCQ